jgi:hypothetical protein
MSKLNGKDNAEYNKLYFKLKKIMTHTQIAASIQQLVGEWNNEIEASIKKHGVLLTFFRASKITGIVTQPSLGINYLLGKRKPPQWLLHALRELVKRHVPASRQTREKVKNEAL